MIQAGCDERGPALPSEWGVAVSSGKAAWCRDSWNWADTGRGDSDYTIVTISTIDDYFWNYSSDQCLKFKTAFDVIVLFIKCFDNNQVLQFFWATQHSLCYVWIKNKQKILTFWPWIRIEMELNKQKIFFLTFWPLIRVEIELNASMDLNPHIIMYVSESQTPVNSLNFCELSFGQYWNNNDFYPNTVILD